MTQGRSRALDLALIFGFVVLTACANSRTRGSAGGAGGGDGGSTATGGGGSGGGGGTSSGGAGGSGGETSTGGAGGKTTCSTNGDCGSGVCEPVLAACVECVATADCPSGGHCLGNKCQSLAACAKSGDCTSGQVCDPGRGICVECATPGDCANGAICILNRCVTVATCQSKDDCGGKLCDTSTRACVTCLTDTDCDAATQHCVSGGCRPSCSSDEQCKERGLRCDTASSTCVQCRTSADCPASMNCVGGACQADLCDSTQSTCSGNGVSACNEAGNGWATATVCAAGQACTAYGGVASCSGSSPDGGTPPEDGGSADAPGCTSATTSPCTAGIPRFLGTQTLDGKGDDLCSLPSFEFGIATPGIKKNNINNIPDSQFETVTARVGWTATGIVAFFDVKDASIQTVNMKDPGQAVAKAYQGDSIEFFVSSTDALTGLTATDSTALQLTIPANGPAAQVKTAAGGSPTQTALPAAQYAQTTTPTGYAIELKLPWPGAAPSAGAKIRFDLALNSADTNSSGVDDMRDAQLVYYLGTVSNTTCPNNTPDVWCDDRTWCSTTALP